MMDKILIIEDDADIAEIERDYLDADGYQVAIAADGVSGLNAALAGDYDLILLDLMLPGMSGFEVCRKLREKLTIPILMVTALGDDLDKIRGLGLGADDYIEKPFSRRWFWSPISKPISRSFAVRPAVWSIRHPCPSAIFRSIRAPIACLCAGKKLN
jgi:DNA-binding response OmpR family regulator